jgi:signal transduction histidine kinase
MQERMKLVGGQLSIASQLAQGTTIVARVPLRSQPEPNWSTGSSSVE